MFQRLKNLFGITRQRRLDPDANCVVTVDERGVSCTRPDGTLASVLWEDLQAVIIETTDAGPFTTDLFWILVGRESGCVVPQGATGEDVLLEKLQAFSGFDTMAVIAAMGSTENQRFLCWQSKAHN